MRRLGVSLLACFLSGLAAGLLAQQLAVRTGASEEFVLVFMAVGLFFILCAAAFLVAQFFGLRAINRTAVGLAVLVAAGIAALAMLSAVDGSSPASWRSDLVLLGSLALPLLTLLAVHWLTVRLMHR